MPSPFASNRVAIVYGAKAGVGGLGHCAASTISALAEEEGELTALGPGYGEWPLAGGIPAVRWLESPAYGAEWKFRWTWLRWRTGELVYSHDRKLGAWAGEQLPRVCPTVCYSFTQVGWEALRWARSEGIYTILENPNGNILNFSNVCERESLRWSGTHFGGHPTSAMVDRVLEEYSLADSIRVYSDWGKRSMIDLGVPVEKIQVIPPNINLKRFVSAPQKPAVAGPLRVCFVGSLDLRKGFVYLLRALRAVGARHVVLDIVGATGDRNCARLFARERQGLEVQCFPGSPLRSYQESEIFVLPTLEDGFGLVAAEAMACGLPVIVTSECGAAECVSHDVDGWIVAAANVEALAAAVERALQRRRDLPEMGRRARLKMEEYCRCTAAKMKKLRASLFLGNSVHDKNGLGSFAEPN